MVDSFVVPVDATRSTDPAVELALATPIVLAKGESLYVSVELPGTGATQYYGYYPTSSLCIEVCFDSYPGISGLDFWSNATSEPYAWADTVADFGFTANITAHMRGTN